MGVACALAAGAPPPTVRVSRAAAVTSAGCRPGTDSTALTAQIRSVTRLAAGRLSSAAAGPATLYPKAAYSGDRRWRRSSPAEWTSGFFPGALWYAYELRGGAGWSTRAARWTAGVLPQARSTSHDVGFMLGSSAGQGLRLAGGAAYRTAEIRAAR